MRLRGFVLVSVLVMLTLIAFLVMVTRQNTGAITEEFKYLQTRPDRHAAIQSGIDVAVARILARREEDPLSGDISSSNASGTFTNLANRTDLNKAPAALIVATLRQAGLNQTNAERLAGRIIDWRDETDEREVGGGPESADYDNNRNEKAKDAPFGSILELGQIPGINSGTAATLSNYVTTYSGLSTINRSLVTPQFLLSVPGISLQTRQRLTLLIEEGRGDLREIIENEDAFSELIGEEISASWEVDLCVTSQSGYSENVYVVITTLNGDVKPYRILAYEGPLERVGDGRSC